MNEINKMAAKHIFDRGNEKLDNHEDCGDELRYLSLLDEDLYKELSSRYLVVKNTTGYAMNSVKHNFKILIRSLVG